MSAISMHKGRNLTRASGWCGAFILLLIVAVALLAPWITTCAPTAMIARPYLAPGENAAHWLGTDTLGRDIWSGIAWGHACRYQLACLLDY